MFDIGFWELIVIGVVALLVVGPERFPGMVKKTGQYVGQFRRIAASVKSEIQVEVDKAEQLQDLLDEQKQILKRNAEVDLTQPAVKKPSSSQSDSSTQALSSSEVTSLKESGASIDSSLDSTADSSKQEQTVKEKSQS